MTSDPDFKVTTFLDIGYLKSRSYYRTSIESRMRCIAWWHYQWPWRTLVRFWRSQQFWSRISQKPCVSGTMLLKNT